MRSFSRSESSSKTSPVNSFVERFDIRFIDRGISPSLRVIIPALSNSSSSSGCERHRVDDVNRIRRIEDEDYPNHAATFATAFNHPFVVSRPPCASNFACQDRFDLFDPASVFCRMLEVPLVPPK